MPDHRFEVPVFDSATSEFHRGPEVVAGDVLISIDGSAPVPLTNLPVRKSDHSPMIMVHLTAEENVPGAEVIFQDQDDEWKGPHGVYPFITQNEHYKTASVLQSLIGVKKAIEFSEHGNPYPRLHQAHDYDGTQSPALRFELSTTYDYPGGETGELKFLAGSQVLATYKAMVIEKIHPKCYAVFEVKQLLAGVDVPASGVQYDVSVKSDGSIARHHARTDVQIIRS